MLHNAILAYLNKFYFSVVLFHLLLGRNWTSHFPTVRNLQSQHFETGSIFRLFMYSVGIFIQWGSENRPFKIWSHSKYGIFEGRYSNGPDFKWSCPFNIWKNKMATILVGFQMVKTIVPTIWKPTVQLYDHIHSTCVSLILELTARISLR